MSAAAAPPAPSPQAPSPQAPSPQAAQGAPHELIPVVICVITGGRPDVSLSTALSIIKLQGAPLLADVHFVSTLDDALNALRSKASGVRGMFMCTASLGFDMPFVMRAIQSGHPVVAASYALPTIDWQRVQSTGSVADTSEPPEMWGARYNVIPRLGAAPVDGYVQVSHVENLGMAWISSGVIADILKKNPSIVSKNNEYAALATPGLAPDGRHETETQRFLRLYEGPVVMDVECPVVNTGLNEFGGCVGLRPMLR